MFFNAVKHSGKDSAAVHLHQIGSALCIVVEDFGSGFDLAALPREASALGLQNVKRRIDESGGAMEIVTAPGRGARITITAPLG